MQTQQTHVHYAPASVGALMDTGFLRGAVRDAEAGSHHDEGRRGRSLLVRWRAAWRAAVSIVRPPAHAAALERRTLDPG